MTAEASLPIVVTAEKNPRHGQQDHDKIIEGRFFKGRRVEEQGKQKKDKGNRKNAIGDMDGYRMGMQFGHLCQNHFQTVLNPTVSRWEGARLCRRGMFQGRGGDDRRCDLVLELLSA